MVRIRRRGGSAIEFSLVSPVMILMFMGIIEYSWMLAQLNLVSGAAVAGARAASVVPAEDMEGRALEVAEAYLAGFGVLAPSSPTITYWLDDGDPPLVVIAIDASYAQITGLVPHPSSLRYVAAARLEQ